jgi:hypothetical protein
MLCIGDIDPQRPDPVEARIQHLDELSEPTQHGLLIGLDNDEEKQMLPDRHEDVYQTIEHGALLLLEVSDAQYDNNNDEGDDKILGPVRH